MARMKSSSEFTVLQDFEMEVMLKMLTAQGAQDEGTSPAKLDVEVETAPVQINFNHKTYNHLVNISQIFTISAQKQKQFLQQEQVIIQKKKQEIMQEVICQGAVKL
jgi:hypothetical protein